MVIELLKYINYFITLAFTPEVLWAIAPLIIATILIIIYFEIYHKEDYVWSSYLSNSLVLLFVSLALFKYLFSIEGGGYANLIDYPAKSIATIALLFIGVTLTKFNFEHVLPERFSKHLSSPLTINLAALGIILFVYSSIKYNIYSTISLIILVLILILIFNLIKFPIKGLRKLITREKKQERFKDTKEAVFQRDELKRELKSRDKELTKIKLKKADEQKQEAVKIKKIINKEKLSEEKKK